MRLENRDKQKKRLMFWTWNFYMTLALVLLSIGTLEDNIRLRLVGFYVGFELACEFQE